LSFLQTYCPTPELPIPIDQNLNFLRTHFLTSDPDILKTWIPSKPKVPLEEGIPGILDLYENITCTFDSQPY
jgi:hypothetical protein